MNTEERLARALDVVNSRTERMIDGDESVPVVGWSMADAVIKARIEVMEELIEAIAEAEE